MLFLLKEHSEQERNLHPRSPGDLWFFLLPALISSCFIILRTPGGWSTTKQKELWQHQHNEAAKPVRRFWDGAQSVKEQSSVFSAGANALPPSLGQQHGKVHSCTPLTWLRKQTKCGLPEGIQLCQKTTKCFKDQYCPDDSPLTALLQLHVSFYALLEGINFRHQALFQTLQISENMKYASGES